MEGVLFNGKSMNEQDLSKICLSSCGSHEN